ncbi:hypothetical protein MML48_4g00016016 [Holotrichia oblita]|uniref:Uncharacterized protein n=1 Tax=Holotrichia oblita TaxID=644536 RepID=A0ACB9T8M1_HOLOL|nr:hypothetical protein MML48_4g00016016 [Holotrichia oblita]
MANRPSFMQDFINLYRKHKCLWKIKDSTYANRALRTKAYEELLDLYKTVDVEATLESVKNKINNMRSAFRKELKKVKLSKKSGTSPDETYTPSLWYYDSLLFTADQEECRETFSSSMDMQDESEKVDNEENELESDLDNIEASNSVTSETTCSSRTTTPTSRKRPRQTKNDVMLEKAYEVLSSGGDNEFKTVGANVAWKLQRMEENQRNIAEHLINTILHYGITKKLTDNVTIHLNSPNRYGYNIANNIYSQDPINNSQTQHIPSQLYQPSRFVPPPTPFQIQSCTQPQSPNQSQPQFHSQPYSQPPIPPQTEPHSQTHSISQLTQHLNENDTVYSMDNYAEVYAILQCAHTMNVKAVTNRRIHIMSDSQAALKALLSRKVSSRLVTECLDELVKLSNRNKVWLTWIPGHQGIEGNARADELAKRGSEMEMYGPEPFFGITRQTARRHIGNWVRTKQQEYWRASPGIVHGTTFIGKPCRNRARELLHLSRKQLCIVTGLMTGHAAVKEHLHKIGVFDGDTKCRLCGIEPETADHILRDCEALDRRRQNLFGIRKGDLEIYLTHSVRDLYSYNTGIHKSTQISPYELVFGQKPKIPNYLNKPKSNNTYSNLANDISQKIRIIKETACENQIRSKEKSKNQYDKTHNRTYDFNVHDFVLLYDQQAKAKNKKLSPNYKGPYKIIQIHNNDTATIEIENNKLKTYHFNMLKPYIVPDNVNNDENDNCSIDSQNNSNMPAPSREPTPSTSYQSWHLKKPLTSQELHEEMDNLSDITDEGDLSDMDPNFNPDDSEFGEESGSSSDNSDAEIIQAEGG